jgi:hypothetical protein
MTNLFFDLFVLAPMSVGLVRARLRRRRRGLMLTYKTEVRAHLNAIAASNSRSIY